MKTITLAPQWGGSIFLLWGALLLLLWLRRASHLHYPPILSPLLLPLAHSGPSRCILLLTPSHNTCPDACANISPTPPNPISSSWLVCRDIGEIGELCIGSGAKYTRILVQNLPEFWYKIYQHSGESIVGANAISGALTAGARCNRGYRRAANHSPCPSTTTPLLSPAVWIFIKYWSRNCAFYIVYADICVQVYSCLLCTMYTMYKVNCTKKLKQSWRRALGSNYPSVSINPPVASPVCLPSHSLCHSCSFVFLYFVFATVFVFLFLFVFLFVSPHMTSNVVM